jgi:RTX calcium-binding nonapeptide repeat (4 copies)
VSIGGVRGSKLWVVGFALIVGLLGSTPASAQTPVDECHEGTASLTVDVRAEVPLFGCVHDIFHNPVPGVPVIWRLETTGVQGPGGDDPAHFANVPEQVTGADGRANAVVRAHPIAAGHLTNVFFCTDLNLDGICDQPSGSLTSLFQISWVLAGCVQGTDGPDVLQGTAAADCIKGLKGADVIRGGRRGDVLYGGAGPDRLIGGAGSDTILGGPGFDICRGRLDQDFFVSCEEVRPT